jgi:hypothetical protein
MQNVGRFFVSRKQQHFHPNLEQFHKKLQPLELFAISNRFSF